MRAGCSPACPCGLHMPSCHNLCRWHCGRCCWSADGQPCCCPGTQKAQAAQIGQGASGACSLSDASLGLSDTGCSPPIGMVITCPASYWGQIPTGLPPRSNRPAAGGVHACLLPCRDPAHISPLCERQGPSSLSCTISACPVITQGRQHLLRSCPAQARCSASAWCRLSLACRGPSRSCCCPKRHPLLRPRSGTSQDRSRTTVHVTTQYRELMRSGCKSGNCRQQGSDMGLPVLGASRRWHACKHAMSIRAKEHSYRLDSGRAHVVLRRLLSLAGWDNCALVVTVIVGAGLRRTRLLHFAARAPSQHSGRSDHGA